MNVIVDREDDGRWIADVEALPGVTSYGRSRDEAVNAAIALAFRVLADRVEHGESIPGDVSELFVFEEP